MLMNTINIGEISTALENEIFAIVQVVIILAQIASNSAPINCDFTALISVGCKSTILSHSKLFTSPIPSSSSVI